MLGDSAPINHWLIQLAGRLQRQAAAVKRLSSATLYLDALSTVAVALFTQDALGFRQRKEGDGGYFAMELGSSIRGS
jgi:hypothetical protein